MEFFHYFCERKKYKNKSRWLDQYRMVEKVIKD
jgi:hypothetical protein